MEHRSYRKPNTDCQRKQNRPSAGQDGFTESFWMHSSEAQSLLICLFSLSNVGF